jgi:hypothetical protein
MINPNDIKALATEFLPDVVAVRRHMHTHPELSFQEFETSAYIQSKLTEWGIPFKNNIVKTGIVATIEGKNPQSKTIALRADIDALAEMAANLRFFGLNRFNLFSLYERDHGARDGRALGLYGGHARTVCDPAAYSTPLFFNASTCRSIFLR